MKLSALNETGQPVDWWFIYKVPQLGKGTGPDSDQATGYEYVYYDSAIDALPDPKNTDTDPKAPRRRICKSPYVLNGGKGALNLTMDSVFKNFKNPPKTTGWILYNDEMPDSAQRHDDGQKGHTKGVIAFDTDSKTAFWMLHSWPKFADPCATEDPTPKYGQTYMCISLDLDTANKIADQMTNHQEPQVYSPIVPTSLSKTAPLYLLAQPLSPKPTPDGDTIDVKSIGGMPFKVVAKNKRWNKDFWNDLVGPTLGDDMDDETWIRGPIPPIADSDGIHKTFDIKYVNLGSLGAHWAWPETHDHAKWGITLHEPWICVGDINRMVSQRKRGGGTIAFKNQTLWVGLSKAGLVLAPPGHTRTDAHGAIKLTHHSHCEAPPKVVTSKTAISGKTAAAKKAVPKKAASVCEAAFFNF